MANSLPYYPLGYKEAQGWYKSLKEKFVQQIQSRLESKQLQMEVDNFCKELENKTIINSQSNNQVNVREIVSKIAKQYLEDVISKDKNIENRISAIKRQLMNSQKDAHLAERKAREWVLKKINSTFDNEQLKKILTLSIQRSIGISSSQEAAIRYEALIQRGGDLLNRAIVENLNKNSMSYFTTLVTVGGYVKEDLELQALEKICDKFGVEAMSGGARKVGGTETHMDIILSLDERKNKIMKIESLPEIMRTDEMKKELDFFNKSFNEQISATRKGPFLQTPEAKEEMLKKIQYFGVQAKTFSLSTSSRKTGSLQGLRISNQSEMFKEYLKQPGNEYNVINNIKFVGKYTHILQSFGADTLIFSTKDGRYFLSDFIQEMKKQHYFLLFGLEDQVALAKSQSREVPENLKRRYELSSTVVIDKPWYPRVKENRNKTKQISWTLYKPYQKK